MFSRIGNFLGRKTAQKNGPVFAEPPSKAPVIRRNSEARVLTFSKIFRWRLPDGQTKEPNTVEIVGSFTHWKRVTLHRDGKQDSWHAVIHHIVGNRTHHYMLLIDDVPAHDKTCDGLAVPHGYQEEQFALATEKGPRVFMLFGQTK